MEAFPAEEPRLREVKGLAKVTQGHRRRGMGLSGAARPAGSELPGTLTALLVHGQSRAHARVQAHSHTHTRTLARVCTDRRHMPRQSSSHGLHTHVCSHAQGNTVTHSCTRILAHHMQVRTCAHSTYACARTYIYGHRTHTLTDVLTQVCTHSHVVPPPPASGRALGTPVGGQPLAAGRALAPPGLRLGPQGLLRAGLPPHPSTPVTLFAIKSLMLR